MSITGEPQGEPSKVGVAIADVLAGLFALSAIQAALFYSYRTGEGQYIDISLLDSQLAALVNVASNYLISGRVPQRYGHQHANIVPYQTFHARDGAFVVAVGNDRQFGQLCALLNLSALAHDPRFATNPARVEHRDALIPLLSAEFLKRPVDEWVTELLKLGIPTGPIHTVAQALNDPQAQARAMVQEIETLTGEMLRVVGSPYKFSATPAMIHRAPPLLGQHTAEILREVLHYDAAQIARYQQQGVI
jgi:formyl-CoA transferase